MNKYEKAIFAWMNPISGMRTVNSGYNDWRGNFDATKDIHFRVTKRGTIISAYIIRDGLDEEDWEIIVLGQWDHVKQTGWHSSDLKEEG
jgi:hypothetical protein